MTPFGSTAGRPPGRVVAVTGACTVLGGELLRHLEADPTCERVLALDIRPPALAPGGKVEFVKTDLTQPTVDGDLATLLTRHKVDTFVHGAFLSHVWVEFSFFGIPIKQGTPLVFDIGVYTVVLGGILAFLFGLQREAER